MICDGYTRSITIRCCRDNYKFCYRPTTLDERTMFYQHMSGMAERFTRPAIHRWITDHLVMTDLRASVGNSILTAVRTLDVKFNKQFDILWQAINGMIADDSGEKWIDIEHLWRKNLYDGIILAAKHPKIASRSCGDCIKYWYNEKTGQPTMEGPADNRRPMLRDGVPMCRTQTGCPKGTPEQSKELSANNKWALRHHQQCKAVGQFPDDPIVRESAEIIERAMRSISK